MALRERDSNRMHGHNSNHNVIEITSDDDDDGSDMDEQPLFQSHKSQSNRTDSYRRGSQYSGASAYQTPPTSSAPRASQSSQFTHRNPDGRQTTQAERDAWLAEDEGDLDELIASTQNQAAGSDQLVLYGQLATKIVGVRFYRGQANPGEQILMRREPGNPYDKNAIRIDNVAAVQIGHIPRKMAEKLSKYMDASWLLCEGELAGYIGEFDCPLNVNMYGPDPNSATGRQIVESMQRDKLPIKGIKEREKEEKKRLAEARKAAASGGSARRIAQKDSQYANQGSFGDGTTAPVMDDILEASERFSPREIGRTAEQHGMSEAVLEKLPSAAKPDDIKTEMLPYQLQALQWLLEHEDPQLPQPKSQDAVQLWKRDSKNPAMFNNLATNYTTSGQPALANGGLLCDDMGLGKTLEMIALLVADREKMGGKTGPTLIVSPLSVMSNWSGQMATHVHKSKALSVYTYHGSGRVPSMKAADFSKYDVVITTYQTLASDYMGSAKGKNASLPPQKIRASGLYSVDWRRIILDEGHTIRNPQSKGAAAVTAVMAKSRWVLTGTPIVNSLKDLYCLLRFVGITGGLENLEIFNRVLVRPLKAGDRSATFLLQAIMTAFTLRRRKEMKFIDLRLPKLDEYVHRIAFTDKERERYEALNAEAKGLLKNFPKNDGSNTLQAYAHLLEVLLRMRQCCNHWQLCGERVTKLMEQLSQQKTVDLTPENHKALQDLLQVSIQSQEECPVCIEPLHNPVITTCAHAFGQECIAKVIETQHKCPMCRAHLPDAESTLVYPANDAGDDEASDEMDLKESSSKLEAMMQILNATRKQHPGEKTVVFSQWTRFLDVVQARLDREGYTYCRLDGTMSAPQRDSALNALEHDPKCTIMLASLGVCAVGLNLTAANAVILSDTWWAPAIEDQAVDRVHRLGQKRETRVFRLVMDGSIEEQTLEIQADKRKLMRLAFAEQSGKRDRVKAGRLADIEKLLQGPGDAGKGKKRKERGDGEGDAGDDQGQENDSVEGQRKAAGKRSTKKRA